MKYIKPYKIFLTALIINLFFLPVYSQTLCIKNNEIFNDNFTESEINTLNSGHVLVKNTKKLKNLALLPFNEQASQILTEINALKPVYLTEIIQIIPESKNRNIILKMKKILTDIPSYKGIQYYSEHNDAWGDLYSEAKINSIQEENNITTIDAVFDMIPFGTFNAELELNNTKDSLFYKNINKSDIYYQNIKCIKTENMKTYILIVKTDDFWILYGLSGINAPKVPGLSARIELSFMNRIKTFCKFVYDNLLL